MEAKKTNKANIEKSRGPITAIGLLFIGSVVLASFSFTNGIERDLKTKSAENSAEIQYMEETIKPEVEPPVIVEPEVAQLPDEDIIIDSNSQDIPDTRIIVITPPDLTNGNNTNVIVEQPIIDFPDVEASFLGGAAAMQRWIAENVIYPQSSIEMNEQGRVYLSFVVEADGSLSNIEIERGVSQDLDKEAKRLIRKMPNWEAGEAKGKKARTRCRLPINFTLN
jgi:periplasmic protein TonB